MDEEYNLQMLVDYYRNKSSQLEHDFVQYQITAQATISSLQAQLANANEPGEVDESTAAEGTAATKPEAKSAK